MLAIVIPYFRPNFFDQTIISLNEQSNTSFNLYIGDDCSEYDYSKHKIFENLPFNFTYKRFEQNLGGTSLVSHWERCLKMMNGEKWFMILGDDDVLPRGFVNSFYNNLNEINNRDFNVIRYEFLKISADNQIIGNVISPPKIEKTTDFFIKRLNRKTGSTLSEFVFRKSAFDSVGGFVDYPLAWHSDVMAILMTSKMNQIYTVKNQVVKVRRSGISISSSNDNLEQKNTANFYFFYDVICWFYKSFTTQELNQIYSFLEKSFLNDKKNLIFWKKYINLNLKHNNFLRIVLFLLKAVKVTYKKVIKV